LAVLGLPSQAASVQGRTVLFGDDTDSVESRPEEWKEITLELVSTAENSTKNWESAYPYIEDISDGRGYTAGIVGWCSGTGDMLDLVNYHASKTPGNPLKKFLPELRQIMAAPYADRPSLSHELLGRRFTTAWVAAAKTAEFQAAQRAERDRVYWNPAVAAAKRDGLNRLGLYLYYDISVNHGPGTEPGSFEKIVTRLRAAGLDSPAQGGSEVAFLSAVVAARDAVLRDWGDYQAEGRSTIGLKFLRDKNLSLRLPLEWTIYGDAYSITRPPAL